MVFFISTGAEEAQSPSKSKGNKNQVFTVLFSFNDMACFLMGSLEEYHCTGCEKLTVLNVLDAYRNSLDFIVAVVAVVAVVALLSDTWQSSLQVTEKGSSYAHSTICKECLL